jgi:putative ATP-binding cassette transporter
MPLTRRATWTRFLRVAKPFFVSEVRWQAWGMLALLCFLLLTITALNVLNSFVNRDFMTAIEQREAGRFASLALVYALVFAGTTVVAVFKTFTEERLGLRWREWLTRHLLGRYLHNHAYYRMNGRSDIDNPDQRIADDVKMFTLMTLSFLLIGVNSTIALCSFAGILWSITPWLFLAAAVYAAFGSLTTVLLGRRLISLDVAQLKKEADLRYELIKVREHAEPIALLRGEQNAIRRLGGRLDRIVSNAKRIISLNRNIRFFTIGYDYLIQLVPALIVAPLYIQGKVEFGALTQAAIAFGHVIGAFSLIVEKFQDISAYGAVIERVGAACEALEEEATAAQKPMIEVEEDDTRVAYERLTLVTPREGRLLLKNLSLQVPRGKRLLVRGPHGSGRTSLLRATAGLWTAGQGRIVRPPLDEVLFLPQQPYLGAGSLRELLLYATRENEISDERILAILHKVGFDSILERVGGLDVERDWSNLLSLGEQQLVAFARLLVASPRFAFVDEATSALDAAKGRQLYDLLWRTSITYVSVATDPALVKYHDMVLDLFGNGTWDTTARERAVSA